MSGLSDSGPSGNCKQVCLALGRGDVEEVGLGKTPGLREHRPRDGDIIVLGEMPHRFDRRVAQRRKPMGHLGARLRPRFGDQSGEHQIEQPDMIVVEAARSAVRASRA